ncbi:MAG: glycoside hydrolase family 113 [Planctomycetota bacterium]
MTKFATITKVLLFYILAGMGAAFLSCAKPANTDSDLQHWQRRERTSKYQIYCSAEPKFKRAAKRLVHYIEETEGKPASIVEFTDTWTWPAPDVTPVILGETGNSAVKNALAGCAKLQFRPDGSLQIGSSVDKNAKDVISFFALKDGRAILGLVAEAAVALDAAIARASIANSKQLFTDHPGMQIFQDGDAVTKLFPAGGDATVLGLFNFVNQSELLTSDGIADVHARLQEAIARFHQLFGKIDLAPIEIVIHPSLEAKVRATSEATVASSCVLLRRVDCVQPRQLLYELKREVMRIVVFGAFGIASDAMLENGIIQYCADANSIHTAKNILSSGFAELSDSFHNEKRAARSPLCIRELDAAVIYALRESRSADPPAAGTAERKLIELFCGDTEIRERANPEELARIVKLHSESPANSGRGSRMGQAAAALPVRAFVLLDSGGPPGPDSAFRSTLQQIKESGANAVLLTTFREPGARRKAFATNELATDPILAWRAVEIRKAGLLPLYRSQYLGQRYGNWVGTPYSLPYDDWKVFLENIKDVILHDALLAEQMGCEWFFVGTELRGITSDAGLAEFWKTTIADVRKVYFGGLTYASSWDYIPKKASARESETRILAEFENIPFWSELDAISVTGYIPLTIDPLAPDEALVGVASDFANRIEAIATKNGKPVIIAEMGYPAGRAPQVTPWRAMPPWNAEAQRRCYQSFFIAFNNRPWLRGIVVNGWTREGERTSVRNEAFSVSNTDSRTLVSEFFKNSLGK